MFDDLADNIPEKVTRKELQEALDDYARANRDWKESVSRKSLEQKENAGNTLYRLAKALLKNNGFYSYRDAVIDSMAENESSPNPEDFE